MATRPPKLFDRLLSWYCVQTEMEDIQGDLYEVYYDRAEDSPVRAKWLFACDTLKLMNPFSSQRKPSTWLGESYHFNFENQTRRFTRNLKRHPFLSTLKIMGLAIAISAFLYIYDYTSFHNTFDQFHEKKDRIYRVVTTVNSPDLQDVTAWSHAYIKEAADEISGVEQVVRLLKAEEAVIVRNAATNFNESEVFFTDPEFPLVFSYEWIEGHPYSALVEPNSVVITESIAEKYFDTTSDIVGKTIDIDQVTFQVTGLIKDIPDNSDLNFDLLVPFTREAMEDWMFVYLLLEPNTMIDDLKAGFDEVIGEYNEQWTEQNITLEYGFENITEVHFSEPKLYDMQKVSRTRIGLFQLIGWAILIIALVNYINLYTTQLLRRIHNINVQRIVGASKKQLFFEFATESFLFLGISLILGAGITWALKATLSSYTDFSFFSISISWEFMLKIGLALITAVMIAASYALAISMQKARAQVFETKTMKVSLRKVLIGLQFALSFAMILGTVVIYQQTSHIQNQPLGFDLDQTIGFQFPDYLKQNQIEGIKQGFSDLTGVQAVSQIESNAIPGMDPWVEEYIIEEYDEMKLIQELGVDDRYLEVLQLSMLSGEFFEWGKHKPFRAFVINQSMVDHLGWDIHSVLGKKLNVYGYSSPIIGVVDNFYFNSPHELIQPLVLHYTPRGSFGMVRLSENADLGLTIPSLEAVWFKHLPGVPFDFSFVKSDYALQYKEEQATLRVLGIIAGLVILLSLLGMYAILLMLAKVREREMGIRKVNGAYIKDLFKLFSGEFITILIASIVLSTPMVWIWMSNWLEQYPLRITLNPLYFLSIATGVVLSACMVIYYQAFKTYRSNTVESLKHES